jgi:hypothetical protein
MFMNTQLQDAINAGIAEREAKLQAERDRKEAAKQDWLKSIKEWYEIEFFRLIEQETEKGKTVLVLDGRNSLFLPLARKTKITKQNYNLSFPLTEHNLNCLKQNLAKIAGLSVLVEKDNLATKITISWAPKEGV